MGRLIGVATGRPGSGATTTAINLSVIVSRAGPRVLLVDAGRDRAASAGLLRGREVPKEWSWTDGLTLGGDPPLHFAPLEPEITSETVAPQLALARERWDYVIVDLSELTEPVRPIVEVLDSLLLVIAATELSLDNLARAFSVLTEVKGGSNPDLEVEGILITLSDRKLQRFERLMLEISRNFPADVFDFSIPRDPVLETVDPERPSVLDKAPLSRGARGYVELAIEVLSRG